MKTEITGYKKSLTSAVREAERVQRVNGFKNVEFNLNSGLQGIVKLAAQICGTPVALITLLDDAFQHIKVAQGFETCVIDRESSFCTHTIQQYGVMVVEDTILDERFGNNPFVTGGANIRFYAGAPLTTAEGYNLGVLCVLDVQPKILTEEQQHMLKLLSEQALYLMDLQRSTELMKKQMADIERQNEALTSIAFIQSHEFRSPVASILGLMNIIKDEGYSNSGQYLSMMENVVKTLDEKIHMVVAATAMAKGAYVTPYA